ncbi:hypothetical protein SO3561_08070 [Streptomyces olivochromogenes]|uniref:Uncharacterized protein n=1 Tax=Streptomyces olivochromogenes TaxID=1963 RepID=A0A250VR31_STROL|nr:hypothetical protein SO3561_08070 [Streptomyces olivochromogenes]
MRQSYERGGRLVMVAVPAHGTIRVIRASRPLVSGEGR